MPWGRDRMMEGSTCLTGSVASPGEDQVDVVFKQFLSLFLEALLHCESQTLLFPLVF